MKTRTIKTVLLGAGLLFGVILLMIFAGGIACICGADADFYCGAYCTAGKIVMSLALVTIAIQTFRAYYHSN